MKKNKLKKVDKNYLGKCELRQLPKGSLFTKVGGKTIYVKNHYIKDEDRYSCSKYYDINDEKFMRGTTIVTTDFDSEEY
ncbi:MAG: hypothetical protein IJW82_04695 [Clostridia bacterium]|nr:hypothetical protein [Clostridia bacterium]